MKVAVLADIHGNLPALNAVLEKIEDEFITQILVAGDISGGPYPLEVIKRLRALNTHFIRGNFEDYLINIYSNPTNSGWYTSKQWSPTRWAYERLDNDSLEFIKSLSEEKIVTIPDTEDIYMVHKLFQKMSPIDTSGILYPYNDKDMFDSHLKSINQSVLIFAHNHVPFNQKINGCLVLNPGSVGCPLNGKIGAHYAVMEWKKDHWEAQLRSTDYSINLINKAFTKSGFLKEGGIMARALLQSINTGRCIQILFLTFANQLAFEKGYKNIDVIPDEILELAAKKWDWSKFIKKTLKNQ